jgi:hypothetical protein
MMLNFQAEDMQECIRHRKKKESLLKEPRRMSLVLSYG